jgi:putative transposase
MADGQPYQGTEKRVVMDPPSDGKPRIFNTDQGAQFPSAAFTGKLEATGVAISMDGRGRFMDNIFIERLWRSIKYEEIHLKAYADGREARADIGSWMTFYNFRRPHQAMNNQMPMAVWRAGMDKIEAAANAVDMPLAWTTQTRCPHTHRETAKSGLIS